MSNGLDVALMKDPSGDWNPDHGDCYTDIAFADPEWGSFFFNTLGAELAKHVEGEPFYISDTRRRMTFRKSLRKYPLLSRIDDFYLDAVFAPDEVHLLESELRSVAKLVMDTDARAFFVGMKSACEKALIGTMGIRLMSS